jgi:hypothetical protein
VTRGLDDLLAHEIGSRVDERECVLQLVAETERARGLVGRGAPPQPARERLVEQPTVHEQVERGLGRADLHCVEHLAPHRANARQRLTDRTGCAVAGDELAGFLEPRGLAEQERDLAALARVERDLGHERAAVVVEAAASPVEALAPHRRGRGRAAVAADELGAARGP